MIYLEADRLLRDPCTRSSMIVNPREQRLGVFVTQGARSPGSRSSLFVSRGEVGKTAFVDANAEPWAARALGQAVLTIHLDNHRLIGKP